MAAEPAGVSAGDTVDDDKPSGPPPPEKVTLDEMIFVLGVEAGHQEIIAESLRGKINCDHRPAERKAIVFQRALQTLQLVQLYDAEFTDLIKQARASRSKKRT